MTASPKLEGHPLLDRRTVDAIAISLQETIKVMASIEVIPGRATVENEFQFKGDVSAFVTLKSPPLSGQLIVSFSEKGLLEVYNQMLGETQSSLTDEVRESAGEIVNMIYGGFKTRLNQCGFHFALALPKMIDKNRSGGTELAGATLVIPFTSESQSNFFVQITIN